MAITSRDPLSIAAPFLGESPGDAIDVGMGRMKMELAKQAADKDAALKAKELAQKEKEANAKAFEKDLERWIKAARKVGRAAGVKRATKSHHAPAVKIDDAQAAHVREWARGKDQDELRKMARSTGIEVADRGRLSMVTLAAAYNVANPTKRTENAENGLQFSNA